MFTANNIFFVFLLSWSQSYSFSSQERHQGTDTQKKLGQWRISQTRRVYHWKRGKTRKHSWCHEWWCGLNILWWYPGGSSSPQWSSHPLHTALHIDYSRRFTEINMCKTLTLELNSFNRTLYLYLHHLPLPSSTVSPEKDKPSCLVRSSDQSINYTTRSPQHRGSVHLVHTQGPLLPSRQATEGLLLSSAVLSCVRVSSDGLKHQLMDDLKCPQVDNVYIYFHHVRNEQVWWNYI